MEAIIAIAGSILGSLAGKAAEYTVDPIAQQLSYLFKHKSKFQNLRTKVEELEDARERVQQSVHEANRNGEDIFPDVDRWLTVVNGKISEQAETQLQEDEEKAKKKCFVGLCPDFKSRYQLSKKAEKEANTIAELLNQRDRFDGVSHRSAPHLDVRPVKEYEAFESRSRALSGVMEALKDDNCNTIGVYGMGGVGKTTLVKEVAKQAKEKQLFDKVVFVPITQTPNSTVTIQDEIAEKSDLKINETNMDVRAARLRDGLKKKGKVLIILDDIWVKLELDALGIPSRDEHKGCKILMTSRKLDVLQSMESQEFFPIDILKEDEAWNLFKNMAGGIVERSDLQSIATEVSQKCAGLPIAIATVAKALKHKENLFEWKNALLELRSPSERNFKGIPAGAYSAIELSYKFLEAEELQLTFLLCTVMGHDAAIEDLLKYCRGLGLFRGLDTIEKVRTKVLTLVSDLKDSSLLLAGSTPERFDMHDVVCDVAISIASRDRHWLALRKEDVFEEWSDEETMRNYNLISLQYAKVSELPHELECPNLTFFSMSSEDSSLKIPNNLFKGMERLKVLDFTKMKFSSLPLSMGFLENIRTLCLSKCMLKDIVIIGELRNLEILNLRKSDIAMLPREIGQLTKLKLLDLSGCHDLEVISPNVLSRLSRLEELYLYDSFDSWVVEGIDDPIRSNASLVELKDLSHLTTLEVHIRNEQAMPKDYLFSGKMERYKISIGKKWGELDYWKFDQIKTSRMLKLRTNKSMNLYDGVKTLLRNTESLHVDGVNDVMNMLYEPTTEGLPQMKHLFVSNESEIKLLINSMKLVSCKTFPLLESLFLSNLINLEAICYGQLKAESLGGLKVIKIDKCNMLKNLFSFSIARELRNLQEIQVFRCQNITALIVEKRDEEIGDNEEIDIFEFSQLRSLTLEGLESWIGFFYSEKKLSSSQQGSVQSNGTWLFDQKVMFPAMEELTLRSISSIEKLWHVQVPAMFSGVQNLTSLRVWRCHKLKYVFTSSMVKSFVQLKTLDVGDSDEMEEVIKGILGEEEERVFPKLQDLNLENLPNLKRFCCGINPIEFPFLRKLKIGVCRVLSTFYCDTTSVEKSSNIISMENTTIPHYLFNEKVMFPAMEELTLRSISSIEKLWHVQVPAMFSGVQNLTTLSVWGCHKLKYVFTSSMVKSFVQLKALGVGHCDEMEEIIEGILGEEEERVFPKLQDLILESLLNLKRFCCGINPIEFPFLRKLSIRGCHVLSTFYCDSTSVEKSSNIISMENTNIPHYLFNEKVMFPAMEELTLRSISSIEKLWHVQVPAMFSGVQNLTSLSLSSCHKLKYVFTSSMVKSFVQLKTLDVGDCDEMEEVIEGILGEEEERISNSSIITVFPKLQSLELTKLPNLKRFCCGNNPIEFLVLKGLRIERCDVLSTFYCDSISVGNNNNNIISMDHMLDTDIPVPRYLFNQKVSLPMLQKLTLTFIKNLERLWPNQLTENSFSKLEFFYLDSCDKLVDIFSLSMFTRLQRLEYLIIEGCELLEAIIKGEDDGDGVKDEISFPQLRRLTLTSLPKLESFILSGNYTFEFPSLQAVIVEDCPKMKMFSHGESITPMIHKVQLEECGNEEDGSWKGSLNSTTQQLFKERNTVVEDDEEDGEPKKKNKKEKYDEDQGNPSTSNIQEEDQGNPSTSNIQNLVEEVQNSVKDEGNSSTSNVQ